MVWKLSAARGVRATVTGLAALAMVGALAACAGSPADAQVANGATKTTSTSPAAASTQESPATAATVSANEAPATVTGPPPGVVVDYQLGGAYPPPAGIGGVVRDVTATPEPGLWNVCYVNGFQTQPDDRGRWLDEYPDAVLRDSSGEPLIDDGWPDELILDTSTDAKRATIAKAMDETIQECADKGFDAVEFDNLDSYTRSDDRLDVEDAVAMSKLYVARSHELGLAVAQKNTAELGERGRDEVGFDFAIVEECSVWEECEDYTDVYGDAVIAIEYVGELGERTWADICADPRTPTSMILRDRKLKAPSSSSYVFDVC